MGWRDAPVVTGNEAWAAAPMAASSGPSTRRPDRPDPTKRAQLEARLAEQTAAADATGAKLARVEPFVEPVRQVFRAAVAPGRGIVGTGALLETPLSLAGVRGPFTRAYEAMSPPELAPRNALERSVDIANEGIGGMLTGFGASQVLAQRGGQVAQGVSRALADNPVSQLTAAGGAGFGAGYGGAGAEAIGLPAPVGELAGGLLGGAAGAKAGGGFDVKTNAAGVPDVTTTGLPQKPDLVGEFRAGGFVLPPSTVAASIDRMDAATPGRIREALAGGSEMRARAALENQKVANSWAARALGLPEGTPIDKELLERFRATQAAPYEELPRVLPRMQVDRELFDAVDGLGRDLWGNPLLTNDPATREAARFRDMVMGALETADRGLDTRQVVAAVRQFRKNASISQAAMGDPTSAQLAKTYRELADTLEAALERQAAQWGEPELVQRLRQSRQNIARSYDVEEALIGENVDTGVLADKLKRGDPLTGELEYLARMAQEFGPELKPASVVRSPQGALSAVFAPAVQAVQRTLRPSIARALLGDDFQNQFGPVDDRLLARYLNRGPEFPWSTPRQDRGPGGPGAGPVEFSPTPDAPPRGALPGALAADLELAPEPVPGAVELPPADARPGDLTASTPPAPDGVPFEPTRFDIASALGLADEPTGGIPYSRTELPPEAAVGGRLALEPPPPAPAPGSGLAEDLQPPLTDTEVLRLQVEQAVADMGLLPGQRPPGLPDGDFDGPGSAPVEPAGPRGPQGPGPSLAADLALADDDAPRLAPTDLTPPRGEVPPPEYTTGTGLAVYRGNFPDNTLYVPGHGAVATPPGAVVMVEGDPANAKRAIVATETPEAVNILSTHVAPDEQRKGFGTNNLVSMLEYAASVQGRVLNSDSVLSPGAVNTWKRAFADGLVETDTPPDWAAIEASLRANGGRAINRNGEPWIRNVRPGPGLADYWAQLPASERPGGPSAARQIAAAGNPDNVVNPDEFSRMRRDREFSRKMSEAERRADAEEGLAAAKEIEDRIARGDRMPPDLEGRLRLIRNSEDPVRGLWELVDEIAALNGPNNNGPG